MLVEVDSSQITGRMSFPKMLSGGPTILVIAIAFCIASRLGTSSPKTSER